MSPDRELSIARKSAGIRLREYMKNAPRDNFRLPNGTPKQPSTWSSFGTERATPFLIATDRVDLPLMRLLLELGADPLLPNFNGTTPLKAAAGVGTNKPPEEAGEESEAVKAVKMLLELGADVNTVNKNCETATALFIAEVIPAVSRVPMRRRWKPLRS